MGCVVEAVGGIMACSWDALFLTLSTYLNIEEHKLDKVNHGEAFARIVSEIGLVTRRFQWQHEANPAADDKIEHGYRRLPTTSWLLSVLSFFRLCHFVYVSEDAQHIQVVAPRQVVMELIEMSNKHATNKLPNEACIKLRALLDPTRRGAVVFDVETRCRRMEPYIVVLAGLLAWGGLRFCSFGSLGAATMVATSKGLAMLTLSSDPCTVGICA